MVTPQGPRGESPEALRAHGVSGWISAEGPAQGTPPFLSGGRAQA